jgi:hypothetical protein
MGKRPREHAQQDDLQWRKHASLAYHLRELVRRLCACRLWDHSMCTKERRNNVKLKRREHRQGVAWAPPVFSNRIWLPRSLAFLCCSAAQFSSAFLIASSTLTGRDSTRRVKNYQSTISHTGLFCRFFFNFFPTQKQNRAGGTIFFLVVSTERLWRQDHTLPIALGNLSFVNFVPDGDWRILPVHSTHQTDEHFRGWCSTCCVHCQNADLSSDIRKCPICSTTISVESRLTLYQIC